MADAEYFADCIVLELPQLAVAPVQIPGGDQHAGIGDVLGDESGFAEQLGQYAQSAMDDMLIRVVSMAGLRDRRLDNIIVPYEGRDRHFGPLAYMAVAAQIGRLLECAAAQLDACFADRQLPDGAVGIPKRQLVRPLVDVAACQMQQLAIAFAADAFHQQPDEHRVLGVAALRDHCLQLLLGEILLPARIDERVVPVGGQALERVGRLAMSPLDRPIDVAGDGGAVQPARTPFRRRQREQKFAKLLAVEGEQISLPAALISAGRLEYTRERLAGRFTELLQIIVLDGFVVHTVGVRHIGHGGGLLTVRSAASVRVKGSAPASQSHRCKITTVYYRCFLPSTIKIK